MEAHEDVVGASVELEALDLEAVVVGLWEPLLQSLEDEDCLPGLIDSRIKMAYNMDWFLALNEILAS